MLLDAEARAADEEDVDGVGAAAVGVGGFAVADGVFAAADAAVGWVGAVTADSWPNVAIGTPTLMTTCGGIPDCADGADVTADGPVWVPVEPAEMATPPVPFCGDDDDALPVDVLDWQPHVPPLDCATGSGYGKSSGVKMELKNPSRDGD